MMNWTIQYVTHLLFELINSNMVLYDGLLPVMWVIILMCHYYCCLNNNRKE